MTGTSDIGSTPSPATQPRPLARLEDVWASPAYLAITDCNVTYVGPEPYRLNLAESAAVDVAEAAGAVVVDRHATFLLILAASTRIDPARRTPSSPNSGTHRDGLACVRAAGAAGGTIRGVAGSRRLIGSVQASCAESAEITAFSTPEPPARKRAICG